MCEFERWWKGHGQYDELTLRKTLKNACQLENWDVNSRIEDAIIVKPVSRIDELREEACREAIGLDVLRPLGRPVKGGGELSSTAPIDLSSIRQTANSFDRKRMFVQWLPRRLRRVPTVEEALSAYKEHKNPVRVTTAEKEMP